MDNIKQTENNSITNGKTIKKCLQHKEQCEKKDKFKYCRVRKGWKQDKDENK